MADVPDVFVIGSIKMLAQIGEIEKIVELCNEWLDKFESRPTPLAVDVANAFCKCIVPQWEIREECGVCGKPPRH